jgi:DNA replication and repair protein RecF
VDYKDLGDWAIGGIYLNPGFPFILLKHPLTKDYSMRLDWIHLLNFKNCEDKELSFGPGITCMVGPNGRGKTNLLDAIYYLCFTKSFLNTADTQNIRQNEPFFMLEGKFNRQDTEEHIQISFKRGQKKIIRRNRKEYEKMADHIGLLPAVMVCPQYTSIITGGSEERRRWLDLLLSQFNQVYFQNLINYQRVLRQRNSLIKQMVESARWDETTLAIYDIQLAKYGQEIYSVRKQFITEFVEVFKEHYAFITQGTEEVTLTYTSPLDQAQNMEDLLQKSRSKDRLLQYTTSGIHKDDLDFMVHQLSVKKFGSQGQQKTFLMALKLAEYHFLSHRLKAAPLLMLDDVFDKLDGHRVKQLLKKVSENTFAQVFITDTGSTRLKELFAELGMEASFYDI